jgi:hypothetical protein
MIEESMKKTFTVFGAILLAPLLSIAAMAQTDRLQGRWEGTTKSIQGERPSTIVFKKEADGYTGTITGMQGTAPLNEIKVTGDDVTAKAEVDSPQAGRLSISYKLLVQGETLKGEGTLEISGQTYNFTVDLKRVSTVPEEARQRRSPGPAVPQPQQKQSLDYFVGEWTFKWVGRDSVFGAGGRREGTTTFKLASGGKTLESSTAGKSEEGNYQENAVIGFDETTKMLSFTERRGGLMVTSKGDWSSPLGIRFTVDPIKVKDKTVQLKKTAVIISAHSFSVTEELSEDGGPFVRLGQALFSRAIPK